MRPLKPGVEVRNSSIRIIFRYQGEQRRERLCVDGQPMAPTPANIKYANRIAAEIGDKIRLGTFRYADYFPDSTLAKSDSPLQTVPMLFDVMDKWLAVHDIKPSTRRQYRTRINSFWKVYLKNVPVDQVRCSDILSALANGTWTSTKSRNNELSMIRGLFDMAKSDKYLAENPCESIVPKPVQRKKPDPFSLDEVELILSHLERHRPEPVRNFVQLMFFTGLRTSEGLALRWKNIDFLAREMYIESANVYDEEADSTKTSTARTVLLSEVALEALVRQKAYTFLQGEHVFHDPKTGTPWKYRTITDVRSFWQATLKRLGVRYRRPYNMRHTYATLGLMNGLKPAFLAKQLGHSLQMFFEVYAKWISSSDDQAEVAKLDDAIRQKTQLKPKLNARRAPDKTNT